MNNVDAILKEIFLIYTDSKYEAIALLASLMLRREITAKEISVDQIPGGEQAFTFKVTKEGVRLHGEGCNTVINFQGDIYQQFFNPHFPREGVEVQLPNLVVA